jgi:hypothetical protein
MWQDDYGKWWHGQWLDAMWPSHGLPHGSGKMPNEGPKKISKIKKKWGPPNLAAKLQAPKI